MAAMAMSRQVVYGPWPKLDGDATPPLRHWPRMLPCSTWRPVSSLDAPRAAPPPRLSGAVRTHPFAPDGRRRPGETPLRTALSPRYLIRMRPLVQVQSGPPQRHDQWKRWSLSVACHSSGMRPVWDEVLTALPCLSRNKPLSSFIAASLSWFCVRCRLHSSVRTQSPGWAFDINSTKMEDDAPAGRDLDMER